MRGLIPIPVLGLVLLVLLAGLHDAIAVLGKSIAPWFAWMFP